MLERNEFRGDLEKTVPQAVIDVIEELKEVKTQNYSRLLEQVRGVEISAESKIALTNALFAEIQGQIERGQFGEIERAKDFMNFLGVKEFSLSPDAEQKIVSLYNKYSYGFLREMSPSLYNGKLSDGTEYNKIEYVRQMMRENGEEPSDEDIKELWRYREILVKLHYGNWKPQNQLSEIPRLLSEKR